MKVNLDHIKKLIPIAMSKPSTGDDWLDSKFMEDMQIIGHTIPYYRLFWLIAKTCKPRFSVELGSYRAVSAGHFAVGNPDGIVYTVDIHNDSVDKIHQQAAIAMDAHYSNLTYINGWTWDDHVVRKIGQMAAERPIDILFIDAWHRFDFAMREWDLYRPMLADEALVITDDIRDERDATIDMVKFWEELSDGYENFLDREGLHARWIPMGYMRYVR